MAIFSLPNPISVGSCVWHGGVYWTLRCLSVERFPFVCAQIPYGAASDSDNSALKCGNLYGVSVRVTTCTWDESYLL